VILASQSPRRRQLMEEAGYTFDCVPSSFDEAGVEAATAEELVRTLALGKAAAVGALPGNEDEVVIGSDTVVVLEGRVLGKPADEADARAMLAALSGATHQVVTAVSVLRGTRELRTFAETCDVTFYELSPAEIDAYVATGEPLDKAGAYGIQGLGRTLVKGICGDYYTVVGLPIARLVRELRELGVEA